MRGALFYAGAVDAYLSHNLHSGNSAFGVVCPPSGRVCTSAPLDTWDELNVPLPPEPRLFRQAFDIVCRPGELLRITERHTRLTDPPSQSTHRCV